MIQINLLPDVKIEYIKVRQTKRLVLGTALAVIAFSIALFLFMYSFVSVVQKQHLSNLDEDIDSSVATIQNTPEIDKILTVQNQLSVINGKHDQKPAAIRILPFMGQMFPAGTKLTALDVDFATSTLTVSGKMNDINSVNKFVDTMKFAQYKTKDGSGGKPFSDVVLSSYSKDERDGTVSFTVTAKYDPVIFNNSQEVELVIPGIVSTRSSTEKPNIQVTPIPQPAEGGAQ